MAEIVREKRAVRPSFPFAVALVIVAIGFALGWHHLFRHRGEIQKPAIRFACIQPDIPQSAGGGGAGTFEQRTQRALDIEVALSLKALANHPDLLIWPEATIDEGVFNDEQMNDAVRSVCEKDEGYFLLGSQDFDIPNKKLYNAAYLFGPGGDTFEEYRKVYLVVMGEYLPFSELDLPHWLRRKPSEILVLDFSRGDQDPARLPWLESCRSHLRR